MLNEDSADAIAQFIKGLLISTDQLRMQLVSGYDEKPNWGKQYLERRQNNTWTIAIEVNGGAQINKLNADGVVREVIKVLKREAVQ